MNLKDLKGVLNYSFDFADDEIDVTFYEEIEAINEKYLKQINVVSITPDLVICKFTDFLKHHRTAIRKYLIKNYYPSKQRDYLIHQLTINKDITDDDGDAVYHFINYDLADFLTQE